MVRAAVFVALLALCGAAVARSSDEPIWAAVPHVSEEQLTHMLDLFDVRGHYEGVAIVAAKESTLAQLRTMFPGASRLAARSTDRSIVVFEREDLAFLQEDALASWQPAAEAAILRAGARILQSTPSRIFAVAPEPLRESIFAENFKLPYNTEVLPVAKARLRRVGVEAKQRLAAKRKALKHDFSIEELLEQVNSTVIRDFVTYLSGERSDSTQWTRNSYAADTVEAARWIQDRYAEYGFTASLDYFDDAYGPNVIAVLPGAIEPERYFVIGAHFDSRGVDRASTTERAPGANDDGSGTGVLLQTAKLIHDNNLRFRYSIIIGSWCGEEQGLVGSRAYAARIADEGYDLVAMIQGDMLAFRASGESAQCAFPTRYDDPDLTDLAISIVNEYVPDIETCYTTACCSDHQSFYEQGYSATQFFERCGSIADDQYHRPGDLVERTGYDIDQLTLNARAMIANLLVIAEVQE